MANGIDTNTPTVRPPTAKEIQEGASGGSPTPPIAPPQYETPESAFRAEAMSPAIQDFASNVMASPSRYDSGLIQDISGVIDADLAESRQQATTQLDEMMAQRGLVGSSIEGELYKDMMTDLERERTRRMTDLQINAANTYAQDVATAGDIGFRSGDFERALSADRSAENRFASDFKQGQYEFERAYGTQSALDARALELQEQGMNLDEAYRRARLEQESGQFESEQERIKSEFEAELGEVRSARMQEYGFKKEEFDLEVQKAQDAAEAAGRELDIEEARNEAEISLRLQQLEQEAEIAGQTIDLDRERMRIQNEQFADNLEQDQQVLEESRQARLAQIGIEAGRLENETLRIQQEAELAGRELGLQEARDRAEVELRTADRVEQARQANQAISFEEARMEAEEAMFADELAARQTEFAGRLGLEQQQYNEQVAARKAEYQDRNSQRLADQGLQEGTLEHDSAMRAADRLIERDALKLQEKGMDQESAWREAERATMERLEKEAQKIQREGLTAEQAMNQARVDAQKDIATERTTMEKEIATMQNTLGGEQLAEATAERKARFEEMAAQRVSTQAIQEQANTIQATAVANDLAIATANREAEYADRAEERKLKEWATEQDLKMREAEFRQASDDKRLEMILEAVAANVKTGVLADLIASYGNTTTGTTGEASSSGSSGGTGGSIVDPFNPDPPNTEA